MKAMMTKFEDLGYTITHDWTGVETEHVDKRTDDENAVLAKKDLDGVKAADAVVAILDNPKYAYRGVSCEMGCAIALGIPVLIYNPQPTDGYAASNIFYWHPDVKHFKSMDALMQDLKTQKPLTPKRLTPKEAANLSSLSKIALEQQEIQRVYDLIEKAALTGETTCSCSIGTIPNNKIEAHFKEAGYDISCTSSWLRISWPKHTGEKEEQIL